jgi:hypothetical protein
VGSPALLAAAIKANQALTHVRSISVTDIFFEALRWANQYDSLPSFVSDGPTIESWPSTTRAYVLGCERFVVGQSLQLAKISVSARAGGPSIKEVAIYNGRELFRRFEVNGPHLFRTLVLDADLHKTLVIVVTDTEGGTALGNAARSWKAGSNAVIFCSDHTNDCGRILAHGAMYSEVSMLPQLSLDEGGMTWDGGPPTTLPLLQWIESRPLLTTSGGGGQDCFLRKQIGAAGNRVCGGQDSTRCTQIPHLEYSDEVVQAVHTEQTRVFDDTVERVYNPWNTWGNLGGPTPLMDSTQYYRKFDAPSVGIPIAQYAGEPVRKGAVSSLFRSEMTFKKTVSVDELIVLGAGGATHMPSVQFWHLAFFSDTDSSSPTTIVDFNHRTPVGPSANKTVLIPTGGWFAGWSSNGTAQPQIYFNRGVPLLLDALAPRTGGNMINLKVANISGETVNAGTTVTMEMSSFGTSLTKPINTLEDIQQIVKWLANPDGLRVLHGKRQVGPEFAGMLELLPDPTSHVAELIVGTCGDENMQNAVRVSGLQRRWTVALLQDAGYPGAGNHYDHGDWTGHCKDWTVGCNKYTVLGLDKFNATAAPLYVGLALKTHARIGHPVIATGTGAEDVFIQVTHIRIKTGATVYHVAVNNPTLVTLTVQLSASFPEVKLAPQAVTLQPGEHLNVQ